MSKTTNIIILGIGGQGTLTMMEMLAIAAEEANEEVRVLSRVSLARLGGSGMCHVRIGPSSSPTIPVGEADILLTLEMSEVLRALPMACRGALAFINTFRRLPIAAGVAGIRYPTREQIEEALNEAGVTGIFVPEILPSPTNEIEGEQQSQSRINIIMLGVFCGYTQLLPRAVLENSIASRLPRFAEQNLRTFSAGWGFAESLRAQNIALTMRKS
jgi:indolepyruvate ferredoxin oxidoreductase, beta subunit